MKRSSMDGGTATATGIATKFDSAGGQIKTGRPPLRAPRRRFRLGFGVERLVGGYGQFVGKDSLEASRLVLVMQHHDGYYPQRLIARTALGYLSL